MTEQIQETSWIKYNGRSLEVTSKTKQDFEEWQSLMETFNTMHESSPWWRGDLYNIGAEWYGEDLASSVFDENKWSIRTWQNNASVCQCIPVSRRREELQFSHHAEVAYLEPDQFEDPPRTTSDELQMYYLEIAVANNMSVRQLRDKIKEDKGIVPVDKPLRDRLNSTAENILEWLEESEGDVYGLMTTAWEALTDAVEILDA